MAAPMSPDFSDYSLSMHQDGHYLPQPLEPMTPLESSIRRPSLSTSEVGSYFTDVRSLDGLLGGAAGPEAASVANRDDFTRQSRGGGIKLRLLNARDSSGAPSSDSTSSLPRFGLDSIIEGVVDLMKTDGLTSVEAKIEGKLKLREVAGGGNTFYTLCLDTVLLWSKDRLNMGMCPASFSFRLKLPKTVTVDSKTYALPPTYEAHVSGIPGFRAEIEYAVSVTTHRPNLISSKFVPQAIDRSRSTVSAPFVFCPRNCPQLPLPPPLRQTRDGFDDGNGGWTTVETVIQRKQTGKAASQEIDCKGAKLYVPSSRVFCMTEPIPFRMLLRATSVALAAFLPFGPTASTKGTQVTKIQIIRQTVIDVRNREEFGTKTDMWRVDCIGNGTFQFLADGPDWISFSGEIKVEDDIKIAGFKVVGLTVKDCIVLSMTPPDPKKCPFKELRLTVPIQLTTDPRTESRRGSIVPMSSSGGSSGGESARGRLSSTSSQYSGHA